LYTLFKIDPTRSGDVLIAVLGAEFDGVLGCDYWDRPNLGRIGRFQVDTLEHPIETS
jgi:hypothetical protein